MTEVTVKPYQEKDAEAIVGVGSISSFWGSPAESILLTVFVLPKLHHQGIGSFIIDTLEADELFLRRTGLKFRRRSLRQNFIGRRVMIIKTVSENWMRSSIIGWKSSGKLKSHCDILEGGKVYRGGTYAWNLFQRNRKHKILRGEVFRSV